MRGALRWAVVGLCLALTASAALANGPHVQLYFMTNPGLKEVSPGSYWEANVTGSKGLEIVASVVRTKGSLDLFFANQSQFGAYKAALASGSFSDRGTGVLKLNATRIDIPSFRLPEGGTYHLLLDNTPFPRGGAGGDTPAEAYVLFASTSPPGGGASPSDPFLTLLGDAIGLSVVLGLAAFAVVTFDKLPAAEAKRGLLAGMAAGPLFAGLNGLLAWLLLLPLQGPGGSLADAAGLRGLAEGLFAVPFGLAFLGARRVLSGGPVKQGVVLAVVAWFIFVVLPWLQSPAVGSWLDVSQVFLDLLPSLLVLGAATGWLWGRLEKRFPAPGKDGKA